MKSFLDQARDLLTSAYTRGSSFIAKNPTPIGYLQKQVPAINQNIQRLRNIDIASTAAGGAAKNYIDTRNLPAYSPKRIVAQSFPAVGAVQNILSPKPTFFSEQVQRAVPGRLGQGLGLAGEIALPGFGGEFSAARGIKGIAQSALKSAPIGAAYGLSQAQTAGDIPRSLLTGALFAGTLGGVSKGIGQKAQLSDSLKDITFKHPNGKIETIKSLSRNDAVRVMNELKQLGAKVTDIKSYAAPKGYKAGIVGKGDVTKGRLGDVKKGIVQPGNTYADLYGVDPESTITVYRGVKSSQNGKLSGGEWVTQDRELARLYSRDRARASGEDAKIISQKVKAKDLIIDPSTNPGVENEFRYQPNIPQPPSTPQGAIVGKPPSEPPKPPTTSPISGGGPTQPTDPVQRIIQALKEAKPVRGKQEALYSQERGKRIAKVISAGENVGGEAGFHAQLGALKGELPKVQFESIRKEFDQPTVDAFFNMVEKSHITPFEKVTAKGGLAKLLGAEGGSVPTKGELELLGEIFPPEFIKAVQEKRPLLEKIFSTATDLVNLPKSIMASVDLSAPFRQGLVMIGKPKEFGKAFGSMFKYAFSENAYKGLAEEIRSRPTYQTMREAKLAITDSGANIANREEQFLSNIAEKIPLVRASSRAYTGFLTKLRADVFDSYLASIKKNGTEVTPELTKSLATFVNSATGRGDLGAALNKAAPVLNGLFFSPRLIAARVNILNPIFYARMNPAVRKEAVKTLFTSAAMITTTLALAKAGGAEVGTDPRSADFGKIKVGNTRYDVMGGFQQYIRLIAQLISGKVISSTTGREITLGEGYKPLTRKDVALRFIEGKLAPVPAFINNALKQQTATGEPFDPKSQAVGLLTPLQVQDIYDLVKEYGIEGLVAAVPGVFGVGSQTYGSQEVVQGKDQFGMSKTEIQPRPGFTEAITQKVFGKGPLKPSAGYNVEAYYKQLKNMPKEQAASEFDRIARSNPDLAKKIVEVVKNEQLGVTVKDQELKAKGVQNGDRARAIAEQFNRLKTKEEKAALWEHLVKTKVITKEVAIQVSQLLKGSE